MRTLTQLEIDALKRRLQEADAVGHYDDLHGFLESFERGYILATRNILSHLFEGTELPDLPELPQPTRDDIIGSLTMGKE